MLEPTSPMPKQVADVQEEIEVYSARLEEMLRSVEELEKQVGVGGGESKGWMKQLAEMRGEMEKSLKAIMTQLVQLSLEHKDDLGVSTHIVSLYKKLGKLISGGVAELVFVMKSGSDTMNSELSLVTDWSNTQLLTLKQNYKHAYKGLSLEVQEKLTSFHTTFVPYLDYVSEKYTYYSDPANVSLSRERIEDDLRSIARRTAYHDYPVLGYTADNTWNILTDSTQPVSSRLWSLFVFFAVTLFLFLKALFKKCAPWHSNHTSRAASGSQS